MDPHDRIEGVRRFNRFYTRRIGALNEGLLDSAFTLTECRILWELAQADEGVGLTATALGRLLDLDAGYLSRLLRALKERKLVKAVRSEVDARQWLLQLTAAGRRAFAPLDRRSQAQADALLGALDDGQQAELLRAFGRIQALLEGDTGQAAARSFVLRGHRPGDLGWLVSRHGALYARDHGWDIRFEASVARIAADIVERFDPRREACWVAERDGANIGGVCLVQAREPSTGKPAKGVAQLRLLLVEPSARGLGVGARLVAECTRFARDAGYRRIQLQTDSQLTAARRLYAKAGYTLVASEAHHSFGHDLVGETWAMDLHERGAGG